MENSIKLQENAYHEELYRSPFVLTPAEPGMYQTTDSFLLNISAYQRSVEEAIILPLSWSRVQHIAQFNISVAFSHVNKQNQDRLFKIRPVVVDEDGTEELTWNNIDPRPLLSLYEHHTVSDLGKYIKIVWHFVILFNAKFIMLSYGRKKTSVLLTIRVRESVQENY